MFSRLFADERGNIALIGALSLVTLVGAGALAVELGQGYSKHMSNQRIADMAALGSALAYSTNSTNTVMTQTAKDIGVANGVAASSVTAALVTSPSGSGNNAIKIDVLTYVPVIMGRVLGFGSATMPVRATAWAELGSSSPACIMALSTSGNAISASGGTSLTASGCSISSNSNIRTVGGASIVGKKVTAVGTVTSTGGSSVTSSPTPGQVFQNASAAADPESGNAALNAAFAQLGTYTAPDTLSNPVTPTGTPCPLSSGSPSCGATWNGATSTFTFPPGNYNITSLSVPGGTKVVFTGGAGYTVNINSGITSTGAGLSFGPGIYNINGGISMSGGSTLNFGDGTYNIGSGTVSFVNTVRFGNGNLTMNANMSLGGGASVTMGTGTHKFNSITMSGGAVLTVGAGDLSINGQLNQSGGGTVATFGAGNVRVGNSVGTAISLGGGASLSFGAGTFSANGSVTTRGGSSITFGAGSTHYINGNLDLQGSSTFGAGTYYINGNFTNNTGGSMTGTNVSFIMAGTATLSGGTSLNLAAPSSSAGTGVPDILIATRSGGATSFGGGSQNVYSGVIYAPNSALSLSGGSGVSAAPGACMSVIANTIDLNGGSNTATACPSLGGASTLPKLVQ